MGIATIPEGHPSSYLNTTSGERRRHLNTDPTVASNHLHSPNIESFTKCKMLASQLRNRPVPEVRWLYGWGHKSFGPVQYEVPWGQGFGFVFFTVAPGLRTAPGTLVLHKYLLREWMNGLHLAPALFPLSWLFVGHTKILVSAPILKSNHRNSSLVPATPPASASLQMNHLGRAVSHHLAPLLLYLYNAT